jgi:hypothetical protein
MGERTKETQVGKSTVYTSRVFFRGLIKMGSRKVLDRTHCYDVNSISQSLDVSLQK